MISPASMVRRSVPAEWTVRRAPVAWGVWMFSGRAWIVCLFFMVDVSIKP
jgi:hypothetical protein